MRRRLFLLLACAPAALSAQPNPGSYPTIETAPPAGFGDAPPGPDGRPSGEAGWYAQAHGVSEAEAQRRMRLQHEVVGEIGRIGPRLEAEQRGNYADIWIEHTPEWRVVVGFVRDPEATLRRYTANPLFVARQVRHSLVELHAGQADAFGQLRRLGIPAEGGTYVSDNEVRIIAAVDAAEVAALLASGRLRVPPFVRVTGADALDPAEPVAQAARRFVRILPQARHRTGAETAELNVGTIVLRDGCFRLDGAGEDDPFAFFGAETGIRLDDSGALILYQRGAGGYGGDPARVGERMVLGGGAGREIADAEATAAVRAACGPGRVVFVGNPRSYYAFRRRHSAWRVDAIAQRQRVSREEAWRRLSACWAREDEFADRVRRGTAGPDPVPPQPCEDPPPPPPPPRR
ncbi:MAG TPA: hypothetical protein VF603_07010 [Allosphingosinicella sp.]